MTADEDRWRLFRFLDAQTGPVGAAVATEHHRGDEPAVVVVDGRIAFAFTYDGEGRRLRLRTSSGLELVVHRRQRRWRTEAGSIACFVLPDGPGPIHPYDQRL